MKFVISLLLTFVLFLLEWVVHCTKKKEKPILVMLNSKFRLTIPFISKEQIKRNKCRFVLSNKCSNRFQIFYQKFRVAKYEGKSNYGTCINLIQHSNATTECNLTQVTKKTRYWYTVTVMSRKFEDIFRLI